MKELPKFLFASNTAARPDERFIVHTQKPSFIAKINHFTSPQEAELYISAMRPGRYHLRTSPVFLVEIIQFFEAEPDLEKIDWIIERTARWYQHTHFDFDDLE